MIFALGLKPFSSRLQVLNILLWTPSKYNLDNCELQSSCVLGNTIHRFLGNQTHVDYFKLLRKDGNSLLIGARNMIFNLSLPTLEENVLEVSQFITFMHSQLASFPFGLVNYESARYESPSSCLFWDLAWRFIKQERRPKARTKEMMNSFLSCCL